MPDAKFIFTFEEGDGTDRMLLGGKGANLCAMTQIGLNVPPGFVITTAACLAYLRAPAAARRTDGRRPDRDCRARTEVRQGVRIGRESAARFGAIGFGDVDARHDGHDPESRPQRGDAAGARGQDRQPALRLGCLPALHPALRQDRDGRARRGLRRGDGGDQAQARRRARRRADRRGAAGARRGIPRRLPQAHARDVPRRPLRAARTRDPGGVPVVERQARRRLPAPVQDHAGDGQRDRGQCLHDGVRQHGRRLGHRRRASPAIRRRARTSSTASTW